MNANLCLSCASLSLLALTSCVHLPPAQTAEPPPQPASQQTATAVPAEQQEILASLPLGIIGGTETVYLENIPHALSAKVDTGADTSSIHAEKLTFFERDGKPWVRFHLTDPADRKSHTFERRIRRRPKIKRHGAESIRRPVVQMKIRLGTMVLKGDFSLTDRSHFDFPILIGQNILNGRAAVDVSRNNLLGN